MKERKKEMIIGMIIFILIIAIVLIWVIKPKEEKKKINNYGDYKVNTKNEVIGDKVIGDISFTNTSMIEKDGITTLTTTITNKSEEIKNVKSFTIYIKDKEDKVITELIGYVGSEIMPGKSKVIKSSITDDLTKAEKVEYIENK